ncbi:hypothetical protein, partial [Streptococcus suis]
GNIKYDTEPFTAKDKRFNNKSWLEERNKLIKDVFQVFKYEIGIFDQETQIAQKKLYKGAKDDYKEYAQNWNREAKRLMNQRKEIEPYQREAKKLGAEGRELQKRLPGVNEARQRLAKKRGILDQAQYALTRKDLDKQLVKDYERDSNALAKRVESPFFKGYRAKNVLEYLQDIYRNIKLIREIFESGREKLYQTVGTISKYQEHIALEARRKLEEELYEKERLERSKKPSEASKGSQRASEGYRFNLEQIREMNRRAVENSKTKKQSRDNDLER